MSSNDFDIVIAGDFRFVGGTSAAIAHDLRALRGCGLRIAVLHYDCDLLGNRPQPRNPILAREIELGHFPELDMNSPVVVRLLVLHNPMSLRLSIPSVKLEARQVVVVAHQVPRNRLGDFYYDPWWISRALQKRYRVPVQWAPISDVCRTSFSELGFQKYLTSDDWSNFVFCEDWDEKRAGFIGSKPIIGRHGRVGPDKWPSCRQTILAAYPDDPQFDVRILGADLWLEKKLGGWPKNWQVFSFGEMSPKEFLAGVDFFVYFHHEDLIEAFGRTIIEAAASGCICVLPPHFRSTFGGLALYCEATEVQSLIKSLWESPVLCEERRTIQRGLIIGRFGPSSARSRYLNQLDLKCNKSAPWMPMFEFPSIFLRSRAAIGRLRILARRRISRLFAHPIRRIRRQLGSFLKRFG